MNGNVHETTYDQTARMVEGGSLAEAIAGGAGIVLAIIGLANVLPQILLPIATIALGAGLVAEGGVIAARFSNLLTSTGREQYETMELGVGLTSEVVGGIAGIVLGILALINVAPMVLLPIAAIVFGATLLFGTGINSRLNNLQIMRSGQGEHFREIAREAVSASAGVQMFLGLASITLGILAVIGIGALTLTLVALLCVGVSDLVSGSAIAARMMSSLHS